MAYNWQTGVDDPYSSYYAGYDPVQSYMDSYFTQQAQAQNAQPPAPTGGAGGVANTVAGLTGTGLGYYTVNNVIPGIGSAATAAPATPQLVSATLSGVGGSAAPAAAFVPPAIPTPLIGSAAADAAPAAGGSLFGTGVGGAATGLAAAAAIPLIAGALYNNVFSHGRPNSEKEKDPFRDQLKNAGFLDSNYSYTSPSGQSFNFGVSGSKAPHADLNDPIQSGIYGQAQDLVKGYFSPQFDRIESLYKLKDRDALAGYGVHGNSGGEGAAEHKLGYGAADIARNHQTNNLVNDLASYFTVAAAQGAPDLASANSNFQAMANQLGYNKDKKK